MTPLCLQPPPVHVQGDVPEGQDGAGRGAQQHHCSCHSRKRGSAPQGSPQTRHTAAPLPPTPLGHGGGVGGPTQRPPLSQHKGHKYPIPPLISTSVRQEATSQHSPHSVSSPQVPAPPPPKQKEEDWGGDWGAVRSCSV